MNVFDVTETILLFLICSMAGAGIGLWVPSLLGADLASQEISLCGILGLVVGGTGFIVYNLIVRKD